jgi:hypothetical protein
MTSAEFLTSVQIPHLTQSRELGTLRMLLDELNSGFGPYDIRGHRLKLANESKLLPDVMLLPIDQTAPNDAPHVHLPLTTLQMMRDLAEIKSYPNGEAEERLKQKYLLILADSILMALLNDPDESGAIAVSEESLQLLEQTKAKEKRRRVDNIVNLSVDKLNEALSQTGLITETGVNLDLLRSAVGDNPDLSFILSEAKGKNLVLHATQATEPKVTKGNREKIPNVIIVTIKIKAPSQNINPEQTKSDLKFQTDPTSVHNASRLKASTSLYSSINEQQQLGMRQFWVILEERKEGTPVTSSTPEQPK